MIIILILAAFAGICYRMAKNRGRNGAIGAVLGFFFGVFAIVGYYIAGPKK